jgi:hypothetical protein
MSVIKDNTVISSSLDYKSRSAMNPIVNMQRLPTTNFSGNLVVPAAGTAEMIFSIGAFVPFIPAQCRYAHSRSIASQGVGYQWTIVDSPAYINEANVYTEISNARIMDLTLAQNYTKAFTKLNIKQSNYLCQSLNEYPAPTNSLTTAAAALRHDATVSNVHYIEPQYLAVGGAGAAFADTTNFALGDVFGDSFWSIKQTVMFPEKLIVRFNMAGAKQGWYGTLNTTPVTNAASLTVDTTLSNIYLYVARDMNPVVKDNLLQLITARQFKLNLPFVHATKKALSTALQNLDVTYTRTHGKTLNRIVHTVFNTESNNTILDHSNVAGAKVNNWMIKLDDVNYLQYNPDAVTKGEDFYMHKQMLKGTPILNSNIYQYNAVFVTSFDNMPSPADHSIVDKNNIDSGRSLALPIKYAFEGVTANAAYSHYVFACVHKELSIEPDMTIVSSG